MHNHLARMCEISVKLFAKGCIECSGVTPLSAPGPVDLPDLCAGEVVPAIRGDNTDSVLPQNVGKRETGELTALISVEDSGVTVFRQGFFQGRDAEISVHGVGKSPGQHFFAVPVLITATRYRKPLCMGM